MGAADDVREHIREAASAVLPEYDVVAAYLYGSFARGDANADSDVDVALYFADYDIRKLLEVGRRLREAAGIDRELDVRALNRGTPRFRFTVIQEGSVIYESDRTRRADVEERIEREYRDTRPLVHDHWATRREVVAGG
ncbi:MAG: nucleotidyltransferase domain-containing protein [Candidatus Nanohaloarchaea archaeon]